MRTATPEQMKKAEANAVSKGISYIQLMENAGKAAAEEILKAFDDITGKRALILCGKGNNGGDGFVIARLLNIAGANVTVALTSGEPRTGISAEEYEKIAAMPEISILPLSDISLDACYDVIADCIFGTGFHGELPESILAALTELSEKKTLKIAVDIPSGADSISGKCSAGTFKADMTITFGAIKMGMLHSPAKLYCGKIITADIGIDDGCFEDMGGVPVLMDKRLAANAIPLRGESCHKGSFGKLLIIGGSNSMSGAVAMNVTGALRSGAGLVRLASLPRVIDRVAAGIYECTYAELRADDNGFISRENIPVLLSEAERSSCVAIGSGMGISDDGREIVSEIIRLCGEKKIPLIIDADGLNSIAGCIDIIRNANCRAVLTPHPAELGRLLHIPTADVTADRQNAAMKLSELTGAIVCAKGYPTFITSPDGNVRASLTGNGGLSRGGSGDVLTGIISGIVCANSREISENDSLLFEAASAGVFIFGLAADIAADELSMTGMLPTDVTARLGSAFKHLGR